MISPVLIGGFVEMDKELILYMPRIGNKVVLEKKVCSKNSVKIKSTQHDAIQNSPKNVSEG